MAWYDDGANLAWPNVLMIAGVAVLAPIFLPVVGAVLRPVVKGAVKAGLTVKDMAAGFVAEAGEQVSDLYAEAKAEHCAKPEAWGKPSVKWLSQLRQNGVLTGRGLGFQSLISPVDL